VNGSHPVDGPGSASLLTPGQVAERLRVSRSMIYALVRRRELEAIYVGRLPRVSESALRAYLERAQRGVQE
jgi:excisionase family DNA binding protein